MKFQKANERASQQTISLALSSSLSQPLSTSLSTSLSPPLHLSTSLDFSRSLSQPLSTSLSLSFSTFLPLDLHLPLHLEMSHKLREEHCGISFSVTPATPPPLHQTPNNLHHNQTQTECDFRRALLSPRLNRVARNSSWWTRHGTGSEAAAAAAAASMAGTTAAHLLQGSCNSSDVDAALPVPHSHSFPNQFLSPHSTPLPTTPGSARAAAFTTTSTGQINQTQKGQHKHSSTSRSYSPLTRSRRRPFLYLTPASGRGASSTDAPGSASKFLNGSFIREAPLWLTPRETERKWREGHLPFSTPAPASDSQEPAPAGCVDEQVIADDSSAVDESLLSPVKFLQILDSDQEDSETDDELDIDDDSDAEKEEQGRGEKEKDEGEDDGGLQGGSRGGKAATHLDSHGTHLSSSCTGVAMPLLPKRHRVPRVQTPQRRSRGSLPIGATTPQPTVSHVPASPAQAARPAPAPSSEKRRMRFPSLSTPQPQPSAARRWCASQPRMVPSPLHACGTHRAPGSAAARLKASPPKLRLIAEADGEQGAGWGHDEEQMQMLEEEQQEEQEGGEERLNSEAVTDAHQNNSSSIGTMTTAQAKLQAGDVVVAVVSGEGLAAGCLLRVVSNSCHEHPDHACLTTSRHHQSRVVVVPCVPGDAADGREHTRALCVARSSVCALASFLPPA